MRRMILIALAFASPLAAQHEGHGAHHVAGPQEIADNKVMQTIYDQVTARPAGPQTRAIWADISTALKAKDAGDRAGYEIALKAARQKLAAPVAAPPPLPPEAVLNRAKSRYLETLRDMRIRLDPSPSDKRPFRKYKATAATTAALKVKTGTPAQIAKAVADLDTATAVLNALMAKPRP